MKAAAFGEIAVLSDDAEIMGFGGIPDFVVGRLVEDQRTNVKGKAPINGREAFGSLTKRRLARCNGVQGPLRSFTSRKASGGRYSPPPAKLQANLLAPLRSSTHLLL